MIGQTLAHYRITAAIGAGGMGEVYRATDTKLGREVAIKVLPADFARDPDRLARFEREARLLASLNHPRIAHVYGFESAALPDGSTVHFLAMELVPGEDLAERLKRGPIALDEALEIAAQIAEGLEEAHEHGIAHRDLKPANVKLTPDGKVKVLDFGLAKACGEEPSSTRSGADLSQSPTLARTGTQAGIILGTAAYMSPEQARGKAVDKRTDIWAFGVVLYEMLTGRKPFDGGTVTDILAAVVKSEPDWSLLPQDTPVRVRDVLRRCLKKGPEARLRDIGDARLELAEALEPAPAGEAPPGSSRPTRRLLGALAMAMLGALAGGVAVWGLRGPDAPRVIRLGTVVPVAEELLWQSSGIAVSPDGSRFVFRHAGEGRRGLFQRTLAEVEPTFIPGSEDGLGPFFSPDGQWIGYFVMLGAPGTDGLKMIRVEGGAPRTLAATGQGALTGLTASGSWGDDGQIVFAGTAPSLLRVSTSGGASVPATTLDEVRGEQAHVQPQLLPGGRALLYVAMLRGGRQDVMVASSDGKRRSVLVEGASSPRFSPTGHLLFVREATLFAAPFDLQRLALTGEPFPAVEGLEVSVYGHYRRAQYDLSAEGTLAYLVDSLANRTGHMVWVDRQGRAEAVMRDAAAYVVPRLSPDGRRLAYSVVDRVSEQRDVWVLDLDRGTKTRLTLGNGLATDPVWSSDGGTITFASTRVDGRLNLFSLAADGGGEAVQLTRNTNDSRSIFPRLWLPDGSGLVFHSIEDSHDIGIWRPGSRAEEMLLATPFAELEPSLSPGGRFLAYVSEESGRREVYARALLGPERRWPISSNGGDEPVWSRRGDEIFYRRGSEMMVVPVKTAGGLTPGVPAVLFEGRYDVDPFGQDATNYDVTPDGKRFVMVRRAVDPGRSRQQLRIVLNWFEDLKRLAPAK